MDELSTGELFFYADFKHRALFEKAEQPWEILKFLKDYLLSLPLGKIVGEVEDGAILVNPELISIGEGSVVEPGAYIKGPCVIGKDTVVRHGAYIRGNVLAGDRVVIGHTTEAKNTVFMDGAQAGHFAYLGDTVLGNGVNVGAGTKCANLRLDRKEIVVEVRGKRYVTGLKKFGALIGDGAQIGCNAVTNPGTIISMGGNWYPCVNGGGFVPKGGTVRLKAKVEIV